MTLLKDLLNNHITLLSENNHMELLEMVDKIEKTIEEARQFPEGEKPILIGPTSAGKSSKFIIELAKKTTDEQKRKILMGSDALEKLFNTESMF